MNRIDKWGLRLYSARSVCMGSTANARRSGKTAANPQAKLITKTLPTNRYAVFPVSLVKDKRTRYALHASGAPITIPAARVCGDPDPGVHHREPGKSVLHLMIALCAGCHAKVHRTKVVLTELPPLLLVLVRRQPIFPLNDNQNSRRM